MENKFLKLLKIIEENNEIILFHHVNPDYDTLGAQFAFFRWLTYNFKEKKIMLYHLENEKPTLKHFGKFQKNNINYKNALGIILDTGISSRIVGKNIFTKCKIKVSIDHHINHDNDFDLLVNDINISSTCELAFNFFYYFKNKFILSKECGRSLYYGLITDTGRFINKNTTPKTFIVASKLMKLKINIFKIYNDIYSTDIEQYRLQAYIGLNLKIVGKFAYFLISPEILKKFNVSFNIAKKLVFVMKIIKNINIFCLVTENEAEKYFSFSVRSANININNLVKKYGGGGHKLASGTKIFSRSKSNRLIEELSDLANEK